MSDVKNLNVSKIKFQVQGQMMFVWVNNPYYKERDLCDNEAFKKLNCIWENKKLVLKINMDAVPSYAAVMVSFFCFFFLENITHGRISTVAH